MRCIDRLLSDNERKYKQVCGAFLRSIFSLLSVFILVVWAILIIILAINNGTSILCWQSIQCLCCDYLNWAKFVGILSIAAIAIDMAVILTPIFLIRKEEKSAAAAQIAILLVLASVLLSALLIFKIDQNSIFILVTGGILSWIFQDTLKSVAAYLYLSLNNKLHIGDWIEVKSLGIDGKVKSVTLTSIEITNWDTTTSLFPTHVLLEAHYQNHQQMLSGHTYGRQMTKTFTIDTGWIHALKDSEMDCIRKHIDADMFRMMENDLDFGTGKSNLHAFRVYLRHYLMMHDKVSHEPRLSVKLVEHASGGIRIQICVFLKETALMAFEEEQSLIMEHVIESIAWFGMRLYQSPRGNSNDSDEDEDDYLIEEEAYDGQN